MGGGSWTFVLDEPARLLIVDDDPILREFGLVHLQTPVADVDTAEDGEAGWARLNADAYDLVLVDLEMPRLDGFGLVARMRADPRFRHVPAIMLTGREDMASIDRAYAAGATSFMVKPVNWRQLSHQIRYVLRTHREIEAERHALRRLQDAAREALPLLAAAGADGRLRAALDGARAGSEAVG